MRGIAADPVLPSWPAPCRIRNARCRSRERAGSTRFSGWLGRSPPLGLPWRRTGSRREPARDRPEARRQRRCALARSVDAARRAHGDGRRQAARAAKLMAAMAQQDCGQCGYNCADYANAIFLKKEERLNLCAPGGKETAPHAEEAGRKQIAGSGRASTAVEDRRAAGRARAKPASRPLRPRRETRSTRRSCPRSRLNGRAPRRRPGTSRSISTTRRSTTRSAIRLGRVSRERSGAGRRDHRGARRRGRNGIIRGRTPARRLLTEDVARRRARRAVPAVSLLHLAARAAGRRRRSRAARTRTAMPQTLDVLGALHKFPGARPDAEAFVESLEPLQPRLYSISSSPKADARARSP